MTIGSSDRAASAPVYDLDPVDAGNDGGRERLDPIRP